MEMVTDLGGAGGAIPQFVARIIFGDDCQFAILSLHSINFSRKEEPL